MHPILCQKGKKKNSNKLAELNQSWRITWLPLIIRSANGRRIELGLQIQQKSNRAPSFAVQFRSVAIAIPRRWIVVTENKRKAFLLPNTERLFFGSGYNLVLRPWSMWETPENRCCGATGAAPQILLHSPHICLPIRPTTTSKQCLDPQFSNLPQNAVIKSWKRMGECGYTATLENPFMVWLFYVFFGIRNSSGVVSKQ